MGNSMGVPHAETSSLCGRCLSMFSTMDNIQDLMSQEGYKHLTLEKIEVGAGKGCQFCNMVIGTKPRLTGIQSSDQLRLYAFAYNRSKPMIRGSNGIFGDLKYIGWRFRKADKSLSREKYMAYPQLKVYTSSADLASKIFTHSLSYDKLNYPTTTEAAYMLRCCQDHHPSCLRGTTPKLPTRVIEVGRDLQRICIRLHISNRDEHADYIALSYCWGGRKQVTTTMKSIEASTNSISLETLPQTIKDAVQVTRELGFRYLWVDALCIIQDSQQDKETEIERMGDIYKYATLTIAVMSSPSVHDGFLKSLPEPRGFLVPFRLPMRYILPFHIPRTRYGNIFLGARESSFSEGIGGHLNARGWAFQEYHLSPRVLVYGKTEIGWKCHKNGLVNLFDERDEKNTKPFLLPLAMFLAQPDLFHRVYGREEGYHEKMWDMIITEYSGRKFTNPEDRLPAIAGIASELSRIMGGYSESGSFGVRANIYLSGMWQRTIARDLCWIPVQSESRPTEAYAGPSWSWASVNRLVNPRRLPSSDIQFVGCYKLGHIRDAVLAIRAGVAIRAAELSRKKLKQLKTRMDYNNERPERDVIYLCVYTNEFNYGIEGLVLAPVNKNFLRWECFRRIGTFSTNSQGRWYGKDSYKTIAII